MCRFANHVVVFAVIALLGCDTTHPHGTRTTVMLFSPNGEPLNGGQLGKPTCEDAMARWLDRVDADHDGLISRDEFMSDAQIQFQNMDIDKNGYLLAEEVDRFRLPYEQQGTLSASQNDKKSPVQSSSQYKGKRGRSYGGSTGGGDTNPADQPDPVMSADANNDFKVTPDEFMAQARDIFAKLDAGHNGTLNRDDVLKLCEQKGR